jgi:hypothetical protein
MVVHSRIRVDCRTHTHRRHTCHTHGLPFLLSPDTENWVDVQTIRVLRYDRAQRLLRTAGVGGVGSSSRNDESSNNLIEPSCSATNLSSGHRNYVNQQHQPEVSVTVAHPPSLPRPNQHQLLLTQVVVTQIRHVDGSSNAAPVRVARRDIDTLAPYNQTNQATGGRNSSIPKNESYVVALNHNNG